MDLDGGKIQESMMQNFDKVEKFKLNLGGNKGIYFRMIIMNIYGNSITDRTSYLQVNDSNSNISANNLTIQTDNN